MSEMSNNDYSTYTPSQGNGMAASVPDYLIWSIITTVLCCNQLCGIPAIIFSILCMSEKKTGNHEKASTYSKVAFYLNLVGLILSVLVMLLYVVVFVIAGAASMHQ